MRRTSTLAALFLLAACGTGQSPIGSHQRPIINGPIDEEHTSVVALTAWGEQFCTGTVIAPRAILTAGHCLDASEISASDIDVFFGTEVDGPGRSIAARKAYTHPDFDILRDGTPINDVGVLTLAADAPVAPMPWQRTPLKDDDVVGQTAVLVGYGVTDANRQTGNGTRRETELRITDADEMFFYYGPGRSGTCQGDSGGPMFLEVNGVLTLVSVTSFGDASCVRLGGNTRVDSYADFIAKHAPVAATVAIKSPVAKDKVLPTFDVEVEATSPAGIAKVEVLVDSVVAGELTAPPYKFTLENVAVGDHLVMARAIGTDGGMGAMTMSVTVTEPPGSCAVGGRSSTTGASLLAAALLLLGLRRLRAAR